ncbi:vacuolar protein sorting-associated protein 72 homolog [Phymastichus coffea]|uniref:vacuolar protein sorting-associated protein 72 homolog n=1 Tax=Phymastichus coffea TaxID=108790 RepID=UPI00273C818D|nr:vacuolar protein sorting-associated protein 72 homolog [Phymastichus coffea]XP_058806865.1 vacuolar protein sorting-associated protein 72 homolog [Phymastichus coffea]
MASARPRRANAGNKMARLLNEEEEDEFYKTTYGGFEETEQDQDYKQEVEVEDEVDSDFSIDENDEPVSDQEIDEKKRKKGVFTKAYKEPAKPSYSKPKPVLVKRRKPKIQKIARIYVDPMEKRSIRHSTTAKSTATLKRLKERTEDQRKRVKLIRYDDYKPTQEELLEEARLTEEINLKSLEKYQRLENEKKNTRVIRKTNIGPMIKYQSFSMPVLKLSISKKEKKSESRSDSNKTSESAEKSTDANENNSNGEDKTKDTSEEVKETNIECIETNSYYERTFVTFENMQQFNQIFKKKSTPRPTLRTLCAITRFPAKYRDPMTHLPYRNVQTFRLLRDAYYHQVEATSDINDSEISPELARWLEYRQKNNQGIQRSTVRLEAASASSTL